eukprot:1029639-Rhodomonas_salina.1
MFTTHWFLAVIATCITPVTWQITKWTGYSLRYPPTRAPVLMPLHGCTRTTVGYYSAVQNEAMAKANSLAVEVLGSVRTVHSNAAEGWGGEKSEYVVVFSGGGQEREAQTFEGVLNKFLRIIKFTSAGLSAYGLAMRCPALSYLECCPCYAILSTDLPSVRCYQALCLPVLT